MTVMMPPRCAPTALTEVGYSFFLTTTVKNKIRKIDVNNKIEQLDRVLLLLLQNATIQGLKYIWRTEGFKGMSKGNMLSCDETDKSSTQYRGIAHALTTVPCEEGPHALYKGCLPSVIGVIPYVRLNFPVYESLEDLIW